MLRRSLSSLLSHHRSIPKKSTSGQRLKFEGLESRTMLTVASAAGDFNGDGRDDLARGFSDRSVGIYDDAGEVQVRYGTAGGLSSDGEQTWTLDSLSVNGRARGGDRFGASLAVGDFNGDGYDDLAIGTPGKTVDGKQAAGAVTILYGSASGLRAVRDQQWSQASLGINGHARAGEHFGAALAAGDFDGDGIDDLAVGTPEDRTSRTHKGVVNVILGSPAGLTRMHDQVMRHIVVPPPGFMYALAATESTGFGSVLASGDFNGDGRDDLAVTTPQFAYSGPSPRPQGIVDIFYGSTAGLDVLSIKTIDYQPNSLFDTENTSLPDEFGAALAVGDFDADGFDDLAISVPGEESMGATKMTHAIPPGNSTTEIIHVVGRVRIHDGGASGLSASTSQFLAPQDFGLPMEKFEDFGRSLAVGDFDDNGLDDLAIGVPGATVSGQSNAGLVAVAYGRQGVSITYKVGPIHSPTFPLPVDPGLQMGLTGRHETWHQDIEGNWNVNAVLDSSEVDDRFGASLAAGDFDGNGRADLTIEVPGEDNIGATAILYAKSAPLTNHDPLGLDGLNARRNQLWFYGPTIIIPDIS